MRIQHNITALSAYRNLTNNNSAVAKNLEKLSSGYRINRAGDDAAGLAISEKMRAQITGLKTAQKNANDGISLVQTAEGAMTEVHSMLNRMVELATQSANGTYFDEDRANLQSEIQQLKDEINRIADSTNFNGINLLDGSLDAESTANLKDASAISNIQTNAYSPSGTAAAFEAKYITNRPPAENKQTNAEFTVKFDDIVMGASDDPANTKNKFKVTIGDTDIEVEMANGNEIKGSAIAEEIAKAGYKLPAANAPAKQTAATGKTPDAETSKWNTIKDAVNKDGSTDAKYIDINGHWYEMTVRDDEVKFTQVDYTGEGGEVINPDYNVNFAGVTGGKVTGTTNWQVQKTTTGTGVGSSHQAQVEVAIDFSKLKDGDTLTAGDMTYVFKIGEGSSTSATASAAIGDKGNTLIDLSDIFKTESDLTDEKKQAEAMTKIVGDMGSIQTTTTAGTGVAPTAAKNNTWSAGNGGVNNGIGKLTFQSLSSYDGDTYTTDNTHKSYIGNNTANGVCDMRTEASVMKQFYGESKVSAANVSFDIDVTKLKAGDTITIDGNTFEFTDGAVPSSNKNYVIDLSTLGISGGLRASQTGEVMAKLQSALEGVFGSPTSPSANTNYAYNITIDGSTMRLTSNNKSSTTLRDESREAAKVELPNSAYAGESLTLQIGDTADSFNQLKVNVKDMHASAMGIGDIDVSTMDGARESIDKIKSAISYVSSTRGDLGAIQNRLEHTINNLSVTTENMTAAESRIRDVDMAEEMMAYTKNNILVQSAQAMLAQANQIPQGVLQLLQ